MRRWINGAVLLAVVWAIFAPPAASQSDPRITTFPDAAWDLRAPAEVGLDASILDSVPEAVGGRGLIIKDGYQVLSWGNLEIKEDWLSGAKPVISTLLMFAVDDGLLPSVDEPIGPYVTDVMGDSLLPKDSLITFAHLANMTSGYALPTDPGPGTRWGYNDYGIKLFSIILSSGVFGTSLDAAARTPGRLGALNFQDGSIFSTRDGHGLFTSPRDFARIGWFWLNRGYWDGAQLMPDDFFDTLTSVAVDDTLPRTAGGLDDYLGVGTFGGGTDQTGLGPGTYGYNFWINADGSLWPDVPHDAYQANGEWNRHAVTVIPSLNMVGVWTGGPIGDPETFPSEMNDVLRKLVASADAHLTIEPGWSQVSIPVKTEDMSVQTVLQDPTAAAFRFRDGQYLRVDTLEVGTGYLVSSAGATLHLSGEHVLPHRVPIDKGWNLVGLFYAPVAAGEITSDPPGIIDSQVFDHLGKDEGPVTVLSPGHAYWIRALDDGYVVYANEADASSSAEQGQHSVE